MNLLTAELRVQITSLYKQEKEDDPWVYCKFFTPDAGFTWYVLEFDGEDLFFGYVVGQFSELGYFSLSELEEVRGQFGLPVERDLWFERCRLSEVKASTP